MTNFFMIIIFFVCMYYLCVCVCVCERPHMSVFTHQSLFFQHPNSPVIQAYFFTPSLLPPFCVDVTNGWLPANKYLNCGVHYDHYYFSQSIRLLVNISINIWCISGYIYARYILHTNMCVCVCVYIYIYTYIYIYIYTHLHVYVYISEIQVKTTKTFFH